jgi:hypothetical protein
VTLVFGGGLFQIELNGALSLCGHDGMKIHPGTDVVSSGDNGGCRHERRMPLLSRCQTSRENSRQASGRSFPKKGEVWRSVQEGTYTALPVS